jgi:hypothetical protein
MRLTKCPVCKEPFQKWSSTQKTCTNVKCALQLAVENREKKERKATKARKVEIRTKREWMKIAQAAWNKYVRVRDYGKPCPCCNSLPTVKFGGNTDCCHYRSIGAASHLRFHLHNAHAGCVKCNRYLSGNVSEYRIGLIKRIGIEKVEALESNNIPRKFDIEYLSRIKEIFTKKARRLEKKRLTM